LSFFNEQDPKIMDFLERHLRIEGLESVLFVMRQPSWPSQQGDPRFWKARGKVQAFLDELYKRSLAPIRMKHRVPLGFRKHATPEHLYLYVKDSDTLSELANVYPSQQEFFKALESTYISELVSEVRIQVRIRNMDGTLTFRDLSEGEQQLLMVLGLLRFTKEDEALFLLDEPDTHLNPAWGMQYLNFVEDVVGGRESSHIIMTTHNPLVIAGLGRSEVRIMQKDEASGHIYAEDPREDPKGMGVAGILTSDLFGLRSTLDPDTQAQLEERRELAAKVEDLSPTEIQRLGELNEALWGLDHTITMRDPRYEQFVKGMTRLEDPSVRRQVTLTPEQQEKQRQLALDILGELEAEGEHPS
jgi:ABC-type multidrug transport system ATPase subunit